jgi:hypothetical protein
LFHDQQERERLARAASTFYEKHNIQAQAERYLDLATSGNFGLRVRPERYA